ncbi:putative anthocyanidin reductase isoform X1 [Cryptomeria japonica]|uniref:putative anthocyanidin reductase isoform X1 n=1 Tax=Cryptomeria japonica TaxID=3369 RepID=UPI0027DA6B11|nr:putative anthocyanidin reductase isoform X1 [Cryptomeria japonica]
MAEKGEQTVKRVCETGAAGYIGPWLVKNLLERGYTVNATLRDPGDERKSGPLLDLAGAEDRLKLFQADLLKEGSFDSAVEGCDGVFHVAGPMGARASSEDYIVPAVNGVLNVMKACTRAKSVRRVIFTSSVCAICPLNDKGELDHSCIDESCWSPLNFLKSQPNALSWYMTAKTLAEQEAFNYGAENNLEVITVQSAFVIGPWITATHELTSVQVISALIGDNDINYQVLKYMQFTLGSIPIVHIEDVSNAHIFLMEHPSAQGRHICSVDSATIKSLKDLLSKQLKTSLKLYEEDSINRYVPFSSKKLLDMGFSYKYSLEHTFEEGIECCKKNKILN